MIKVVEKLGNRLSLVAQRRRATTAPSPGRKNLYVAFTAFVAVGLLAPTTVLASTSSTADAAAGSLRLGYEDGTRTSGTAVDFNACCSHSIVVDDLSRTGKYAIRSHLKYGDPEPDVGGSRAESHSLKIKDSQFRSGDTAYYGFSIYLLSTWQRDSREDIVFQWKPWRDTCESDKAPSAFLTIQASGIWRLRVNSDSNPCSTSTSVQKVHFDLAEVKPGQWHDFVFRFKWSYGGDGMTEAWYQTNKVPGWSRVLSVTGPNTFNDDPGTMGYLKWGIYKPAWNDGPTNVDSRMVFHDNIAYGTSFGAVDPTVP
jgi:hypothetical protein